MSAWQFPSTEFGEPLKLQPQPGSQLQNSRYVPESVQPAMPLLLGSLSRRAYSSVAALPSQVQGPGPRGTSNAPVLRRRRLGTVRPGPGAWPGTRSQGMAVD